MFSDTRQTLIPHDDGTIILVDYYQGAYGPTLMIDIQCADSLAKVRLLFENLASGNVRQASLDQLGGVMLSGIKAVLLKLWPHTTEPRRLVELARREPEGPVFYWTRYSEGWREWAELLDGLDGPGHQYLTGKDLDDAIIEVSFMERPPLPNYSGRLQ